MLLLAQFEPVRNANVVRPMMIVLTVVSRQRLHVDGVRDRGPTEAGTEALLVVRGTGAGRLLACVVLLLLMMCARGSAVQAAGAERFVAPRDLGETFDAQIVGGFEQRCEIVLRK